MIPAHGGQLRLMAERFGLRAEEILDFSANINPDGPPASVLAALRRALDRPETLTLYPDLELADLRAAVAGHLRVAPEALAFANGFVPLLEATIRARGLRRCVLPVPAFGEYCRALELCGVEVIPLLLDPETFAYDRERLLGACVGAKAGAILLANPQNPSGWLTSGAEMRLLVGAAGEAGVTVLLDEAFIDYTPAESITSDAAQSGNLVVFRSVTKFFAMPGLRVAYAVSAPDWARAVNERLAPWPISTLAADATIAALGDEAYHRLTRELNLRRRSGLAEGLEALGVRVYPGAANFLLLGLPDADRVWELLVLEHGVLLRSCGNFEGLGPGYLRCAVRTDGENERVVEALGRCVLRR